MKRSKESNRTCPNPNCCLKGRLGKGNIIRHSFYITRQGRRRRYRCKECGRTFSSTRGTPYYRLHKALVHESELARNEPESQVHHLPRAYDDGLPRSAIRLRM